MPNSRFVPTADVIGNQIVKLWCPIVWEAFCDYQLDSITLTRPETLAIRKGFWSTGFVKAVGDLSKREREEFFEKLEKLNLSGFEDQDHHS